MTDESTGASAVDLKLEAGEPKKLSPLENEQIERYRLMIDFRGKELEVVKMRAMRCDDQAKILELSLRLLDGERQQVAAESEAVKARGRKDKEGYEQVLSAVRARLGIEGAFGYNPDTLEIVEGK